MSGPNTIALVEASSRRLHQAMQTPAEDLTTPSEVKKAVKKTAPLKALGLDNIQAKALRNLPQKALIQLYYIYNSCLKFQYFPVEWKKAIIIPIPKAGKDHIKPENLRPISLLNILGENNSSMTHKVLGRRSENYSRTIRLFQKQGYNNAGGKNSGKGKIKLQHQQIHQRDITRAGESDCHYLRKALIHKMISMDIPSHITKIIKSFLEKTQIAVNINADISSMVETEEGLTQGSILSPTVFNIYIIVKHSWLYTLMIQLSYQSP